MSELPATMELEAALVSDDGAGYEEYDAAVKELLDRVAELEADLKQMELVCTRLRTSWREDTASERDRALKAEAALETSQDSAADLARELGQAEAALAERAEELKHLRSRWDCHDAIPDAFDPDRHCPRAEEGGEDEIMQDVWERRFQEPGVDLCSRAKASCKA